MRALVFDASPIISLTMNNMLWILEPLKARFGGEFLMPEGVHYEVVDRPLGTKMFKLEALLVAREIRRKVFSVVPSKEIAQYSKVLLDTANTSFLAYDHPIQIMHRGETEALATCILKDIPTVVIDERTTRLMLESPHQMQKILEKKNHTSITVNEESLHQFSGMVKNIKPIRSTELMLVAYELGLLQELLPTEKNARTTLLDALLWGLKLDGCSISRLEIERLIKTEIRR